MKLQHKAEKAEMESRISRLMADLKEARAQNEAHSRKQQMVPDNNMVSLIVPSLDGMFNQAVNYRIITKTISK